MFTHITAVAECMEITRFFNGLEKRYVLSLLNYIYSVIFINLCITIHHFSLCYTPILFRLATSRNYCVDLLCYHSVFIKFCYCNLIFTLKFIDFTFTSKINPNFDTALQQVSLYTLTLKYLFQSCCLDKLVYVDRCERERKPLSISFLIRKCFLLRCTYIVHVPNVCSDASFFS